MLKASALQKMSNQSVAASSDEMDAALDELIASVNACKLIPTA